jgi:hypothetical protein
MANESSNKTISSTDSGFPGYLNFDTLRSDAISYLGNLSGKIWTDYNVHDPGITILEALIYAILDLGYRTNLPAVDLFTKDPSDESADNNFFTPAQILANNPLTITDFRKLLIDINGVKNAWLEIEDNLPVDFCKKQNKDPGMLERRYSNPCQCDFLNGLYHVFIELEKEYDLTNNKEAQEYKDVILKIKCALMSHRNLCEDFIDIKILCRYQIGLCADVELEQNADGAEVYLKIVASLQDFFSPSPKFYTLPQLLEKQKPINEIFAGRPYNLKESYGFVDTDELEQITLTKKIHLSDVYHLLFEIDGVKNVRNLSWKSCDNNFPIDKSMQWVLPIPQNHIPEFSSQCSGFQFFKYGMKVKVNVNAGSIFSGNGKILYKQPSPYLDSAIPQGVYRSELADYYSIQNEFPHVYGIKEGDLPGTATNERKAQALQLQGFLLFFDQLLANYLGQLKNIRSLFSFSSSENEADNHTYFTNTLTDVPQLEKLLRFNSTTDGSGTLGAEGTILAYPTSRKNLEDLIASGKIQNTDLDRRCNDPNKDDFPPYQFCYDVDREQAENQLRDDLLNGYFNPVIISNYNGCYFFYCITSSTDFALISKKYYPNEREAETAAASIKYLATFEENYRSFVIDESNSGNQNFSFDLELNLNVYSKYLQLISEDATLYNSRRQDFLSHLLSRFAEQFVDFALLSSGILTSDQLQKSQIKAEENFLTNYPELSSNRGKAYDYKCNGWNNENVSGFEKRVKALSGIQNHKKHYLCNFVVEKADEIYQLSISLLGSAFTVTEKKVTYEAGLSSLNSLFSKLRKNPDFETEFIDHEQKWSVYIKDDFGNKYSDQKLFDTKEKAVDYASMLHSVISIKPDIYQNVFISKFIYKIFFKNYRNEPIEESKQKFITTEEAQKYFNKIAPNVTNYINDSNEFLKIKKGLKLEKLIVVKNENYSAVYIDKNKFEFKPVDVIQLGIVKKKFSLLNDQKTIQFDSFINYDSVKLAGKGFEELLALLASSQNYSTEQINGSNEFKIIIKNGGTIVAGYYQFFSSQQDAQNKIREVFDEILTHTCNLSISNPLPDNWEFQYQLTDPSGNNILFKTEADYKTEKEAQAAAKQFYEHVSTLKVKEEKNDLQLLLDHKKQIVAHASLSAEKISEVTQLLQYHQDLFRAVNNPTKEFINNVLVAGKDHAADQYIYKLVDKDHLLAKSFFVANNKPDALNYRNDLINTIQAGYDYTAISFGSDIIDERKDETTNTSWYHFLIKCNNVFYQKGTLKGQPFILFESTKGYPTKEEAMQTFLENYLIILRKAFTDTNYGANQFISLTEIIIHQTGNCNENISTVFIRQETLYEFDGDILQTIKQLILLAKSYPILYVSAGRYRFSLYNKKNKTHDWRSIKWYSTPQQAMQRFRFFLVLLNYSGNIYIEKNEADCRFYIYIREVLAISKHTFATAEDAWGNEGVEKFVCIAQTENGFHNYLNKNNCSISFYVACDNTGLIHPCKYETPERRDKVLNKLFQASAFNFFDLLEIDENNNFSLLSLDKKPVAIIVIERDKNQLNNCERLIEIFEAIYVDANYKSKDTHVYLTDKNNVTIAKPVSEGISLTDWKEQLREVACYFPLYKKQTDTVNLKNSRNTCNFYVQIKLPGFNTCKDDYASCDYEKKYDDNCNPGCYIAWKSECCFIDCCEALLFYENCLQQIRNFPGYKPVYECGCGYYGIELHTEEINKTQRNEETRNDATITRLLCGNYQRGFSNYQSEFINKCTNEIVAFNPQNYNSTAFACEAVERAKKLINSEGLHLVEHILLRPRCPENCNCDYLPTSCVNNLKENERKNICHFKWVPGADEDPCMINETICFTPGCDPYSFIATIALPAWPARFRSQESKAVIEKLLQKEAPAHVLLRILWLKPRDLCCFEYYFKNWNYWLAKKNCDPDYNNCDFLGLLFHKGFEQLSECYECVPCMCNEAQPVTCFEDEKVDCENFDLVTQINDLYCWNNNDYDTYNCEADSGVQNQLPTIKKQTVVNKPAIQPVIAKAGGQPKIVEEVQPAKVSENAAANNKEEKKSILQSRNVKYMESVKNIADANPANKAAENALSFLSDPKPNPKKYDELVNKILKNKSDKTKKIKGLSLKEKNILIDNISWQYFDRVCINEKKTDKIAILSPLFNHLKKNKIDMKMLYDDWDGAEIEKIEQAININEIKKIL